jgi:hypothetical protein
VTRLMKALALLGRQMAFDCKSIARGGFDPLFGEH